MKKLTLRQLLAVASMLFGLFFGAGNLIFPASMASWRGATSGWPRPGFSSPAWDCPAGGGGAGHQPGGRPAGAEQPGEPGLRPLLHLSSLPDHRALLRHSPAAPPSPTRWASSGCSPKPARRWRWRLLAGVLRGGALFLAAPRRDPHLGGQGAQPAGSWPSWRCCAAGADGASRAVSAIEPSGSYAGAALSTGCWKATTRWTL